MTQRDLLSGVRACSFRHDSHSEGVFLEFPRLRAIQLLTSPFAATQEQILMKRVYLVPIAAGLAFVLNVGSAEARKPSSGTGSVQTNYGCTTLAAGTTVRSSDGLVQKRLLTATFACYICNLTTRVCTLQSPSSLVGWTFLY